VCSLLVPLVTLGVFYDPWPAKDAMDAARVHAAARGHDVLDGGLAAFVTQPDTWGGCEVEAILSQRTSADVVVRVRRSWRLGSWHLVRIAELAPQP
jgi:hypothetical protein